MSLDRISTLGHTYTELHTSERKHVMEQYPTLQVGQVYLANCLRHLKPKKFTMRTSWSPCNSHFACNFAQRGRRHGQPALEVRYLRQWLNHHPWSIPHRPLPRSLTYLMHDSFEHLQISALTVPRWFNQKLFLSL